ncbi:hypothetical protein BDV27DRAFT_119832, partial [Aspergillus caelatus]
MQSACPPVGTRGFEPRLAVEKFIEQHPEGGGIKEPTGRENLAHANDSMVIAVQIETKSALEIVEEIAAGPGTDVLFWVPLVISTVTVARMRWNGIERGSACTVCAL